MPNYKIYGLREVGTNRIRYIGLTKGALSVRLRDHKKLRCNHHKKNWIESCNGHIEAVLIEDGIPTLSEANAREVEYISLFMALGSSLVNATLGGDGTTGSPAWNKGRKCDYSHKLIANSPRSKPVACYSLTGQLVDTFRSVKYASLKTGATRQRVNQICNGLPKCKQSKGFMFRWVDGVAPKSIEPVKYDEAARIESIRKVRGASANQILVEKDGYTSLYDTKSEAAKALGLAVGSVNAYCSRSATVHPHGTFSYA